MSYVDGFVLPVPRKKLRGLPPHGERRRQDLAASTARSSTSSRVADDVKPGKRTSFPQSVKLKRGEVVVFSFIVYRSRGQRDRINKKVMKYFMSDPQVEEVHGPEEHAVRRQAHVLGRLQAASSSTDMQSC